MSMDGKLLLLPIPIYTICEGEIDPKEFKSLLLIGGWSLTQHLTATQRTAPISCMIGKKCWRDKKLESTYSELRTMYGQS